MSNPKLEVLTPQNSQLIIIDHHPLRKQTKAPPRYSDATLLGAMGDGRQADG